MAWLLVGLAGVLEIVWAVGLKSWDAAGPLRRAGIAAAVIGSFVLLAKAMRSLPVGTAYAVWTGIGAAGTAAAGMLFFGEPRGALRLASIALIVLGIAGLRLTAR